MFNRERVVMKLPIAWGLLGRALISPLTMSRVRLAKWAKFSGEKLGVNSATMARAAAKLVEAMVPSGMQAAYLVKISRRVSVSNGG